MYIHSLNFSSEEHGERRESVGVAACVYNTESRWGKRILSFAVYFFKDCAKII